MEFEICLIDKDRMNEHFVIFFDLIEDVNIIHFDNCLNNILIWNDSYR